MAKIFRADPRKWIEDSFIQMKQIMEQRPTIVAPTKLSQVVSQLMFNPAADRLDQKVYMSPV